MFLYTVVALPVSVARRSIQIIHIRTMIRGLLPSNFIITHCSLQLLILFSTDIVKFQAAFELK